MAKRKRSFKRPYERIQKSVRNQSSRNGVKPRLLVLHSTESHNRPGNSDLEAIVGWFDNPASQASSHVIVDNEGRSARCVVDENKAWTQASLNPYALSIEMIGFASQSWKSWMVRDRAQIRKVAKYLAYWSKKHDIPLRRGKTFGGSVIRSGVVTHKQLGAAGGSHHDPGPHFPFKITLRMAQWYKRFGWY